MLHLKSMKNLCVAIVPIQVPLISGRLVALSSKKPIAFQISGRGMQDCNSVTKSSSDLMTENLTP
jgi:hypothetical protein